jgi:hypothetical protein
MQPAPGIVSHPGLFYLHDLSSPSRTTAFSVAGRLSFRAPSISAKNGIEPGNRLRHDGSIEAKFIRCRREKRMRKLAVVVVSVALAFATGCATKAYVKSQVDPLSERIGRIEARLDAIDAKLVQLSKDAEMAKADHAAIEEAKGMAQKAMDMANKAEAEAMRAGENAASAQAAAERAEQAAKAAEMAAAKTEKMFRLQQKK